MKETEKFNELMDDLSKEISDLDKDKQVLILELFYLILNDKGFKEHVRNFLPEQGQ